MDKGALGKISIPIANDGKVCDYVAALALAIADKEREILDRNVEIDRKIAAELDDNQKPEKFVYHYPTSSEVRGSLRLDAGIYSANFKQEEHRIKNYRHGWANYEQLGFEISRGQNLQVSCIGRSVYSDTPKPTFYRLVAPSDISEYRTVEAFRYLGTEENWIR
jgi:type I restriction enzyme S subunit